MNPLWYLERSAFTQRSPLDDASNFLQCWQDCDADDQVKLCSIAMLAEHLGFAKSPLPVLIDVAADCKLLGDVYLNMHGGEALYTSAAPCFKHVILGCHDMSKEIMRLGSLSLSYNCSYCE